MSETYTVVGHPKAAHWRQPRARLLINGTTRDETPLEGFTLSRTRYARCDTAELTLAINRTLLAQQNSKWFDVFASAGQTPPDINVAIEMRDEAHTGAQWRTVFSGVVDKVRWTSDQTRLEVECRDMLAKLMDMRVQMAWLNQTGPDVLNAIIKQAGLTPQVSFPANMTGQFWQVEHKRTSASAHHKFQTAFDLARYIADEFGCDLYAGGNTIVCQPALSPGSGSAVIHPFDYSDPGPDKPIRASAAQMMLERDYVTSKNVMVHVMSWDSRQRAVAETWFSAEGHSRTQSENMGTLYTFRVPGARQDDVERIAEAKYSQIVAHDRTISLTLPGRITLEPRHFMSISGTGSSWDMPSGDAYTVDAVETTWSWDQMFAQTVTLRNRTASDGSNADAGE